MKNNQRHVLTYQKYYNPHGNHMISLVGYYTYSLTKYHSIDYFVYLVLCRVEYYITMFMF